MSFETNEYFEGNVQSIAFQSETLPATVGVMEVGEYTFGTAEKELMEITAGDLDILLPGETQWQTIKGGESFYVPANASFDVKAKTLIDYCCTYIAE